MKHNNNLFCISVSSWVCIDFALSWEQISNKKALVNVKIFIKMSGIGSWMRPNVVCLYLCWFFTMEKSRKDHFQSLPTDLISSRWGSRLCWSRRHGEAITVGRTMALWEASVIHTHTSHSRKYIYQRSNKSWPMTVISSLQLILGFKFRWMIFLFS